MSTRWYQQTWRVDHHTWSKMVFSCGLNYFKRDEMGIHPSESCQLVPPSSKLTPFRDPFSIFCWNSQLNPDLGWAWGPHNEQTRLIIIAKQLCLIMIDYWKPWIVISCYINIIFLSLLLWDIIWYYMISLVLLQYYNYWIPSNVPSILFQKGLKPLGRLRLVDTLADLDEFPTAVISFADPVWNGNTMARIWDGRSKVNNLR